MPGITLTLSGPDATDYRPAAAGNTYPTRAIATAWATIPPPLVSDTKFRSDIQKNTALSPAVKV